jgi:aminocarboxymuconate-semialdehyde decarboxylase
MEKSTPASHAHSHLVNVKPPTEDRALVVDMHCHIATPAVDKLVSGHPMRVAEIDAVKMAQGPAATLYNFKTMLPACTAKMTNLDIRLTDMDDMGVDIQVLSPSPGQYYYWAERDLSRELVRLQNEHIAESVAREPRRLVGLATVSLQHPELAVEQLTHAVRELGLRGVEISSAADNRELGDPQFERFWAKADALGCVVLIHPLGTTLGSRLDRHYLSNVIGQPLETTIALSHLIFGGVFDRYPGLKVCTVHGGGYLPTYLERSEHAYKARPDAHSMQHSPRAYLKNIYFDNLLYTPQAVRALIDQVGIEHVVVGTDYPFDMGFYQVRELVAAIPGLSDTERVALLGGNALKLLETKLHNGQAARRTADVSRQAMP